jgi:thiamine biosynthesis protein ThiI
VAWPPILVRYGEIGIKSPRVRAQFERRLVERIEEQLLRRKVESEARRERGRIFVRAADVEGALDALRHTFGVVSASPAAQTDAAPDAVARLALDVARSSLPEGASFAVRVRRSGQHPFTSLDVAKASASLILDELRDRRPRVDLDAPDLEIRAEVREGAAFVFTRTQRGPGGLPLGSQGRLGVLVEDARAPHAAWLVARRGSLPFFFAQGDLAEAARRLAPLTPWIPDTRVRSFADADALRALLAEHRCLALVRAGSVADALAQRGEDERLGLPVFRPMEGYAGPQLRALCRAAELPEVA